MAVSLAQLKARHAGTTDFPWGERLGDFTLREVTALGRARSIQRAPEASSARA